MPTQSTSSNAPFSPQTLYQVKVVNIQEVGPAHFLLRLPCRQVASPGQVVALTTDPAIPPRLFSLCNGNNDDAWEILFSIKSDGLLSPRLAQQQRGSILHVSDPFGSFLGDDQPAWWIAAGTGIAPFRAMLRSGLHPYKTLIHGARSPEHLIFSKEFAHAMQKRYIPCCSRGEGDGLYPGRLTNWLREQPNLPTRLNYDLCGSAEMVVEVRDILISKHIPIDQIRSEIYF